MVRKESDDEDRDDDLDREGDEGDGVGEAEDDDEPGQVSVERLSDVDDWEMYRLVSEDDYEVVVTLALRPREGSSNTVEYGLWRASKDSDEPGVTNAVSWETSGGAWDDEAREDVLRQVVYRYEDDLKVEQGRLVFQLNGPPEEEDDDDGDDEDEEDEDEDA